MAIQRYKDIENENVPRLSTGIDQVDWIYGIDSSSNTWGLPSGKISLWAGGYGLGKSRACIELCRHVLDKKKLSVLYFQGEADLVSFKKWTGDQILDTNNEFYVSDSFSLEEQIKEISDTAPNLIIIDSINKLEEFGSGTKENIKKIIDGYRLALSNINNGNHLCHLIIICQLNQNGDIKGATDLPHLVDVVLEIVPCTFTFNDFPTQGYFVLRMGDKNRYGKTGKDLYTVWKHLPSGAICVSARSHFDDEWIKNKGITFNESYDAIDLSIKDFAQHDESKIPGTKKYIEKKEKEIKELEELNKAIEKEKQRRIALEKDQEKNRQILANQEEQRKKELQRQHDEDIERRLNIAAAKVQQNLLYNQQIEDAEEERKMRRDNFETSVFSSLAAFTFGWMSGKK